MLLPEDVVVQEVEELDIEVLEERVTLLLALLVDVEEDGVELGELVLDDVEVEGVVFDDGDADKVEMLDVDVLGELVMLLLALPCEHGR